MTDYSDRSTVSPQPKLTMSAWAECGGAYALYLWSSGLEGDVGIFGLRKRLDFPLWDLKRLYGSDASLCASQLDLYKALSICTERADSQCEISGLLPRLLYTLEYSTSWVSMNYDCSKQLVI